MFAALLPDEEIDLEDPSENLLRPAVDDRVGEAGLDGIADSPGWQCPAAAAAVGDFDDYVLLGGGCTTAHYSYLLYWRCQSSLIILSLNYNVKGNSLLI